MEATNNEQKTPSEYRLSILKKMEEYERLGLFDQDLEEDPPSKELRPEDITYVKKGPLARIKRFIAFRMAYAYFAKETKRGTAVIRDVIGAEKLRAIRAGAVITCNHFHPFDSFLMQYTFDASHRKGRMYRIIREGNYTSFPGFYGFLMRHCDTLPLSSNLATMRKFVRAVADVLRDGQCVLIYPEQSLWWNYRKPKPMKIGGFEIAVKSDVPIVPCFVTMEDCEQLDDEGLPVQAYTVHVGDPIYPDASLGKRERAEAMRDANAAFCREIYERVYGIPLTYTTEAKDGSVEK
ncbi:MAG: 1-acyl-sn-glycerol-3-phosphate acyltransferase [Clostridia bacterium]|nr:1-acyl-sn-glycerol-3-phosphate acyltransferase [Clostridia bacterium]